jgi:TolB protein
MEPDGSGQLRLTNNPADDNDPTFNRDGSRIAFASTRDGNGEIYVMNADGSSRARLTNNSASDIQPSFSADGSKIAFVSQRDGQNEVYVMNANGTNQLRLTNQLAGSTGRCAAPFGVSGAVSHKTHGAAGDFDVNLLAGSPAVECRSGGGSDAHTVVFTFPNPLVSVATVGFTGVGAVSSSAIGTDRRRFTVELTGITNAQVVTINLTNVMDSSGTAATRPRSWACC